MAQYKDIDDHLQELFEEEIWEVGLYLARAHVAETEGLAELSACLRELAYDEAKHACQIAEIIPREEIKDPRSNLMKSMAGDRDASEREAQFANTALKEGNERAARLFMQLSVDERSHVQKLEQVARKLRWAV